MKERLHFIGIGGSGMLPLAVLARKKGYAVSGSDRSISDEKILWLEKSGIHIYKKPDKENLANCDIAIFSTAISPEHPEKQEAVKLSADKKLKIMHRMDFLNFLVAEDSVRIGIAGTHGKTSTSSMFGHVLLELGYDPTIIVGGKPLYLPDGVRSGKSGISVFETDESDGSFLTSNANLKICLNVDNDHLEYYGDMKNLNDAFSKFVIGSDLTALNGNDDVLGKINRAHCVHYFESRELPEACNANDGVKYYGIFTNNSDSLEVYRLETERTYLGEISLRIPGRHFATNALSIIALLDRAVSLGYLNSENYSPEKAIGALNSFPGVSRRIEKIARINSADVYDDYGHHPSEIRAVIQALRGRLSEEGRLYVVFQPHRYSRTGEHYREFAENLEQADHVFLLPLYSAGEKPREGISSAMIGDAMKTKYSLIQDGDFQSVFDKSHPGDIFLFQGAGSISDQVRKYLKTAKQTTVLF